MSKPGDLWVDQNPGSSRHLTTQRLRIGTQPSSSLELDSDPQCIAPMLPYPVIADSFKPRDALREYFGRLRGEDKEYERVEEQVILPSCLPKMKTLGLCRRLVGSSSPTVMGVQGDMTLLDKRKFNAPRQSLVKRQKSVQLKASLAMELPRMSEGEDGSDSVSQPLLKFASWKKSELGQAMIGDLAQDTSGVWLPQLTDATVEAAAFPCELQPMELHSPPFKQTTQQLCTPVNRKPLAPLVLPINRQPNVPRTSSTKREAPGSHISRIDQLPLRSYILGGCKDDENAPTETLFQFASGHRFQASAASKARAASLFGSDVEPIDIFPFDS